MTAQCDCSSIKTSKPFLLEFIFSNQLRVKPVVHNKGVRWHYYPLNMASIYLYPLVECKAQFTENIVKHYYMLRQDRIGKDYEILSESE